MKTNEQPILKKLGKNIAKQRKVRGITQQKLADKLETARAYIGHIEQGIKSPSLETIEKIAKVLKVQVKDLFS